MPAPPLLAFTFSQAAHSVIGSLLAWMRRNLTSHLREPYLDPALERQVALNREVVQILQRLSDRLNADASVPDMPQRLAQLETQLNELQQQVAALRRTLPGA